MFSISEEVPFKQFVKYFGPAKVLDKSKDGKSLLLGIEYDGETLQTWGRAVISATGNFIYGDTVLAAGEEGGVYILGLLESSSSRTEDKLIAANGAYVSLLKKEYIETILVHSKKGELIFEYDPNSGKCVINSQPGDIEFRGGNISFLSEGNINLKSRQIIQIESSGGIMLSVKNIIDKLQSSMFLDKIRMKLSSSSLNIISKRADLQIESSRYLGNNFFLVMKHAKIIAGKFETIANDIVTRAKNVFKTVDQLTQLKTGRMRTLVKSTLHIKSKNSYQYSEEDFKVNAEKIHLG
ncbi:MAG TPA: DUF3540 domain-containing protein [Ignavibacteriaceae bacterium]|nr:DUF3540 domain-containing protein [Ignavibacteriaceae bacterium]